jgi:hypothetical protein
MKKSLKIKEQVSKLVEGQMLVFCNSVGNPTYRQYTPISEPEFYAVSSFEEASAVCEAYIAKWDLGGGNWLGGGDIYGKDAIAIAEVSYNGRVWKKQKGDKNINDEILIDVVSKRKFLDHYKELNEAWLIEHGVVF